MRAVGGHAWDVDRTPSVGAIAVLAALVLAAGCAWVVAGPRAGSGPTVLPTIDGTTQRDAGAEVAGHRIRAAQADEPAVAVERDTFTLGELLAGEISPERFNGLWAAQLDAIESTCPASVAGAPGSTRIRLFVGATPPEHLDDAYLDWAPSLQAASEEQERRCR